MAVKVSRYLRELFDVSAEPSINGQALIWNNSTHKSDPTLIPLTVAGRTGNVTITISDIPGLSDALGGTGGTESANTIFGGPASGGAANPTFRSLVDADLTGVHLSALSTPQSTVSFNNQVLSNLATPSASTDATNKNYVDAAIQGLKIKPTAAAATAAALPSLTYNNSNGTLTATANAALSIDSYATQTNDLILVKNQVSGFQNGLYVVTQPGSVSTPFILTRHSSMDTGTEFSGAFIPTGNLGSTNANSLWLANPTLPFSLGTTPVPFTQINGATDLIQGTNISISGNTISTTSTPTFTTVNKVTLTAPAIGSTLTIPDGVTLNAGSGGTLGTAAFTASSAYEVPLTFGSGVTRTVNAISLIAPTTSVLGGVKSLAAVSHNFLTSIGTDGAPVAAQPAFTDISGTVAASQLPGSFNGFANPTASLGLSAANGSAATAMRSDGAPALDVTIAPTWTGKHIFSPTFTGSSGTPVGVSLSATASMTSTGGWTLLKGYVTQSSDTGSGTKLLLDLGVGASQKAVISSAGDANFVGNLTIGSFTTASGNIYNSGNYLLANGLRLNGADGSNTIWNSTSAGQLAITTNGGDIAFGQTSSVAMILKSTGKLGLGTSSPNAWLDILATTTQQRWSSDTSNYWTATVGSTGGMTLAGVGTGGALTITPTSGQSINLNTVTLNQTSSGVTSYVITGGSAVGILQAVNNQYVLLSASSNHPLIFGTNSNEKARITADGKWTYTPATDTSSSGTPIFSSLAATVNQTFTAGYTGLQIAITETATGSGSKKPFRILTGASGATEICYVDNVGNLSAAGTINVPTGKAFTYNGVNAIIANTPNANWFFGGSGNSTATSILNTSMGSGALASLTSGSGNSANGYFSLNANTIGSSNSAFGQSPLNTNTSGSNNSAFGTQALYFNTTGNNNVAIGYNALNPNTTGSNNVAIGLGSGYNIGVALPTMSLCTYLGYSANSNADGLTNSTAIGANAQITASNQIVLGDGSVTSVTTVANITGGGFTVTDAKNIVFGTTTGTKHGTATTQKQSFWNATPVVQPASASQTAIIDSTGGSTADATIVDVGIVFSQAAINGNFAKVTKLLNQVRADLVTIGLLKGLA